MVSAILEANVVEWFGQHCKHIEPKIVVCSGHKKLFLATVVVLIMDLVYYFIDSVHYDVILLLVLQSKKLKDLLRQSVAFRFQVFYQ